MPRRIPAVITEFHDYIMNTSRYLIANSDTDALKNWERLQLAPERVHQWLKFNRLWKKYYQKYSSKGLYRTQAITKTIKRIKKQFTAFAQPVLRFISAIPTAGVPDWTEFHIKAGILKKSTGIRHHVPIAETAFFKVRPLGSGMLRFSCRTMTHSKRAAIAKGASGVELCYFIGDAEPVSLEKEGTHYMSTKANFVLRISASHQGKYMFVMARWMVLSNEHRNGPWGGYSRTLIL